MQTLDIRQDLITRLIKLNNKITFLLQSDTVNVNWTSLKFDIQENINKLKSTTKILEITSYLLLTITGVISIMKVLGEGSWPDLNKGALLILLTVTNTITAFSQKLRIERLEKQILLLDILEKMDDQKS